MGLSFTIQPCLYECSKEASERVVLHSLDLTQLHTFMLSLYNLTILTVCDEICGFINYAFLWGFLLLESEIIQFY